MGRRAINSDRYDVPIPGFSHLIAAPASGTYLFVSGLTARGADGAIMHVNDLAGQTRQVLENLRAVLASAGATLQDVVQIHTYVRDIEKWSESQSLWSEYWGRVWPASTLVQVSRLYDARQLIEMDAIAQISRRPITHHRLTATRVGRRRQRQEGRVRERGIARD